MMNDAPPLLTERDARGVVSLTLNRPQSFNALSEAMLESLHAALDRVAADEAARAVVQAPVAEAGREYTVKSGDTLSKIAKEQYGSTKYDEFLYMANRDRLKNKDELGLGQKLRLPPKPEDDR